MSGYTYSIEGRCSKEPWEVYFQGIGSLTRAKKILAGFDQCKVEWRIIEHRNRVVWPKKPKKPKKGKQL